MSQVVKVVKHTYDIDKDLEQFKAIFNNGYEIKAIDPREGYSIVVCEKVTYPSNF